MHHFLGHPVYNLIILLENFLKLLLGSQTWGCKSSIWEKKEDSHDLSLQYPGEVEIYLEYPTLVSWVHFKHNTEEEDRIFKQIG